MEITILGFISVLIIFFAFLKQKKEILLYAAVFFCGFTGSSVINISTVSIQPSYLFFFLYFIVIFYQALVSTKKKRIEFPRLFTIFLIYCTLTIGMCLIFQNQEIIILNQKGKYENLSFSISNIIHIGYLGMCYLFYTVLINKRTQLNLRGSLYKAYRLGLIAVILICFYQLLAFQFNLPFDIIFRQGVHGNVQGSRLYGPCIEASMLSYYLAPSLFLMVLNIKNYKRDIIWISLGVVIGVLCYSSTFFVGLVLSLIPLIVRFLLHIKEKKSFGYLIALLVIVIGAGIAIAVEWDTVENAIFKFFDTINARNESGSVRTEAFEKMAIIGFKYPLGLGFGASRSKDLLSTWLCNIGIVGVLIFTIMVVDYLNRCLKKNKSYECIPFILCIILAMISVPEPYNLFIWTLMFFGIYGTKGNNITSRDDILERQVYQLWWI